MIAYGVQMITTVSDHHYFKGQGHIYLKKSLIALNASSFSFFDGVHMGDFKNNASISLINVYRLSKADLLLKLISRYVINGFLASCQVSLL